MKYKPTVAKLGKNSVSGMVFVRAIKVTRLHLLSLAAAMAGVTEGKCCEYFV